MMQELDISNTYRLLPIRLEYFPYKVFILETFITLYFNKSLPFGCSIACVIFGKFLTTLHCIVQDQDKQKASVHYSNYFLFASLAIPLFA